MRRRRRGRDLDRPRASCRERGPNWRRRDHARHRYADVVKAGEALAEPREGRTHLLGRGEDQTGVEASTWDYVHVVSGQGFALQSTKTDGPYLETRFAQVHHHDLRDGGAMLHRPSGTRCLLRVISTPPPRG